jgi:hypothetical protein
MPCCCHRLCQQASAGGQGNQMLCRCRQQLQHKAREQACGGRQRRDSHTVKYITCGVPHEQCCLVATSSAVLQAALACTTCTSKPCRHVVDQHSMHPGTLTLCGLPAHLAGVVLVLQFLHATYTVCM